MGVGREANNLTHRKTLLLRNLNRGCQGPIWAVAPLDGWLDGSLTCVIGIKLQFVFCVVAMINHYPEE
jgi:hypothetical protein